MSHDESLLYGKRHSDRDLETPKKKIRLSEDLDSLPNCTSSHTPSPDMKHGFISTQLIVPIQQRLMELDVTENSILEERSFLTQQLAKLQQLCLLQSEASPNGYSPSNSETNKKKTVSDVSVLSVLSPTAQKVLQQVLVNKNGLTKETEKQERQRKSILNNQQDSPYKPKVESRNNKEPIWDRFNCSPRTVKHGKRVLNFNEETEKEINNNTESAKSVTCLTHPSLQRLSRRVKIILRPKGQIYPRTSRFIQDSDFSPIQSTTLNVDRVDQEDNWFPWDEEGAYF